MEKPPLGRYEESEFSLKEWAVKAKISREITKSRRHSASNIKSFREETRSFRSSTTISSTVSSPGYTLRDEINPYTYSFTTALRALQARSGYGCECMSPDGFALNPKWNEAERYICNPLSGEVPMECLSSKTLSGRARISVSGPLVYSSRAPCIPTRPVVLKQENGVQYSPLQGKKGESLTRDVGTQSTPPDLSSSSPSPASTPSIEERAIKRCETEVGGSSVSGTKSGHEEEVERTTETGEEEATMSKEEQDHGGCLPWRRNVWMVKKQRKGHLCGWQVLFGRRNVKIKKGREK